MDRPRSRQRANPVGAAQPEHKPARTLQALEPTKAPSKLAAVNLFGLENKRGHGSNTQIFGPDFTLKFTWFNQNVLRQSLLCRIRKPRPTVRQKPRFASRKRCDLEPSSTAPQ